MKLRATETLIDAPTAPLVPMPRLTEAAMIWASIPDVSVAPKAMLVALCRLLAEMYALSLPRMTLVARRLRR